MSLPPSVLRKQWLWGRFCLACRSGDKAFAHLPDLSPRHPPFYCSLGSALREDVSSGSLSYSVFPPRRDFSLVKTQGRKSELASLIPFSLRRCLTYEALLAFPAATPSVSTATLGMPRGIPTKQASTRCIRTFPWSEGGSERAVPPDTAFLSSSSAATISRQRPGRS